VAAEDGLEVSAQVVQTGASIIKEVNQAVYECRMSVDTGTWES
jgi:hypothetical protein